MGRKVNRMRATLDNAIRIYESGWCDISHVNEAKEMMEEFDVSKNEVPNMMRLVWEIYEENDDAEPLEDGEN